MKYKGNFMKNISLKDLEANKLNIKHIKKLEDSPRKLWHVGYYDGPLSGYCLYDSKPCYFKCFLDYHLNIQLSKDHSRYFAIVEISDEEFKSAKFNYELFSETVGHHTSYKEDGRTRQDMYPENSSLFSMTPEKRAELSKHYYSTVCKINHKLNFENNQVLAWWTDNSEKTANIDLIKLLKVKIKSLSVSSSTSEDRRAHLIAYCLLRGKSYKEMERKCSEFNTDWFNWIILFRTVQKICLEYSPIEDQEKWSLDNIKKMFIEARTNDNNINKQ